MRRSATSLPSTSPRLALIACLAIGTLALGCRREKFDQPAPAPSSTATDRSEWQGVVTSNAEPVPGARVRIQGTTTSTLTDAQGHFALRSKTRDVEHDKPVTMTITAQRDGFVIGHTTVQAAEPTKPQNLHVELTRLPAQDNEAYAWVDPTPNLHAPGNCGNCHAEIFEEWQSGGHARGALNRHFMNLYEGTTWKDTEHKGWSLLDEYPEGAGVCAACHLPSAPLEQLSVGDLRAIDGVAARGVHCDYCHKIHELANGAIGYTHGRFAVNLLRPAHGQLFFGPLDDVARDEDAYAPQQQRSEYCATCHEGIVFGVPVYTTYSEWQGSLAGQQQRTCQHCHMRPTGHMTNIAPGHGGVERHPQTLASHDLLPGGRAAMLRQAITVEPRWQRTGDRWQLDVALTTQQVGHRVPTGFIDRHLLLVIDARNERGEPVEALLGDRLPRSAGEYAHRPGQLYAKQLVDGELPLSGPHPFWRAGATLLDSRLVPDTTHVARFVFPDAIRSARVRLLYRPFWEEIARQKDWPEATIEIFNASWQAE